MQQPGLQQTPAGWPGMPGLQSPLSAQAPQFPSSQGQFQAGQAAQQSPFPFPFPQAQPQQQAGHGFPGQSYQVQPPQGQQFPPQFQPQAQPQFQPQAQPQFQPQAQPQYQTQYQAQAQPAPQPQAPPVPGVMPPSNPGTPQAGGQQAPQSQAQAQAQALARQLVELARTLEQLVPGYQIMQSTLLDLTLSPAGEPVTNLDETIRGLKEALYYHGATLGAIRRLLTGETTPAVLINLAAAFQALSQVQTRVGPLLERLIMASPTASRSPLATIAQTVTAADPLLSQAGASIQALVGPQIWAAARTRIQERLTEKVTESGRSES